ncbi:MAG: LysR substrate-binding domain-containing protein [Micavibrio sp.]|nr:LysR substrate-binding domain-containing protein [Micavibrio sp.]
MLDLSQLRSFLAVAQTGSFTGAAKQLGISQSTVSQHIQRLEAGLKRRLVLRDTHKVSLTTDGDALLGRARQMLAMNDEVATLFNAQQLRGRLRFGVSEDFVGNRLPTVLETFAHAYPSVDLELTVNLSGVLYEMLDAGELDVVLAKRHLNSGRGQLLYREPLVWVARDAEVMEKGQPLPLIAFPAPSITRRIAFETLDRYNMAWRVVCTCSSLSGLTAAARAGMGVLIQPRSMIPFGLRELHDSGLPPLEDVEFVLVTHKRADPKLVKALTAEVLRNQRSL